MHASNWVHPLIALKRIFCTCRCSMLTQSKYSVSIPNRFKVNTRYEHFVRINAECKSSELCLK